jgi:hypothetical protein
MCTPSNSGTITMVEKNGQPTPGEHWHESLAMIDLNSLHPVFDELAGQHQAAALELDCDRKLIRRPTRRRMMNGLGVANAIRTLDGLPAAGESWHIVVRGNFAMFDLIGAVLHLAAPATIARLDIGTLGFSKTNLEELLVMLDAGTIGRLTFLYSVYFRSNEKETCHRLHEELTSRGQHVLAMRTHAKLMLLELTDGRCLVNETSANLRSCRNVEQLTLTHDRTLLEFHRQWLDSLFDKAGR